MDNAWVTVRLIMGIISIVLAVLSFLYEVFTYLVGSFSLNGGDGSEGAGLLISLALLIAGILAIALRNEKTGGIICSCVYALVILTAIIKCCQFGVRVKDSITIYGIIGLIMGSGFLISVFV